MSQSNHNPQIDFLVSVTLPIPGSSLRLSADSVRVLVDFREALQRAAVISLQQAGFPPHEGWPRVVYGRPSGDEVEIVHEVEIQTSHTSWHDEVLIGHPTEEQIALLSAWNTIFDRSRIKL